MRRIFGISKGSRKKKAGEEEPPKPSMEEISGRTDSRVTNLEKKITEEDKKLVALKKKIKRTRGPTQKRYKKQAMMILKRRKMYEAQLNKMSNMHLNTLAMTDAVQMAKDTQDMAIAMKDTVKSLKAQQKQFNIDEMEDVYDDMDDIMMDQEEIQEVMGRSLGDMEDVDEADLEAELEGLDDEFMDDEIGDLTEVPDYVDSVDIPTAPDTVPSIPEPTKTPASGVDEYGLPVVPAPVATASNT